MQDQDGKTPLHLAAEYRNFEATKSLLNQGANFHMRDKFGKNLVHQAAESGSRAVLELFLETPAREFGRDNEGNGLLHFLAMWEWPPVVQNYIKRKRPIIDITNKKKRTPLHHAAIHGNVAVVTVLLKQGAAMDKHDGIGCTALHHAAQQGHEDVVRLLLRHSADVLTTDKFQRTCVQNALAGGHLLLRG